MYGSRWRRTSSVTQRCDKYHRRSVTHAGLTFRDRLSVALSEKRFFMPTAPRDYSPQGGGSVTGRPRSISRLRTSRRGGMGGSYLKQKPKGEAVSEARVSLRERGVNPRALGTNPRAMTERTPTPRTEAWDALAEFFGEPRTKTEQARFGKVVRELLEAGATADEVRRACEYVQRTFDSPSVFAVTAWFSVAQNEKPKPSAQQQALDQLRRQP